MTTSNFLIRTLRLKKHPEGGYFRETYRAPMLLLRDLPARYQGRRSVSTAIYYLLKRGEFSALHRIASDEIWHFYGGAPIDIVMLARNGRVSKIRLGFNIKRGEKPQGCVPAGVWFGAAPCANRDFDFTLTGCTVAPGFDFSDFEMARRTMLLKKFPEQRKFILQWTRSVDPVKVAA